MPKTAVPGKTHPRPLSRRSFWNTLSRGSSTSSRSWAKRHSSSPRSKLANSSFRSRLLFSEKKMAREKYHQGLRKSCFFNFVASFTTRLCLYKYINVCVCGVYKRTHLCAKELTTSPPSRPLGGLVSLLPPSSSSSSSSRACKCRCSISLHHFHSKTSNSHKNATPKLYKINLHFQQMSVPAPNPLVYLQPRMALQVGAYLDGPFWGFETPVSTTIFKWRNHSPWLTKTYQRWLTNLRATQEFIYPKEIPNYSKDSGIGVHEDFHGIL